MQNINPKTDFSPLPPDPEMADWVQRIPAAPTAQQWVAVVSEIAAKYGHNRELFAQKEQQFLDELVMRELSNTIPHETLKDGWAKQRPTETPSTPPIQHSPPVNWVQKGGDWRGKLWDDLPCETKARYEREAEVLLAKGRQQKKKMRQSAHHDHH